MNAITLSATMPRRRTLADEIILVLLGAAAVAVSAQVRLPITWPVPITAQTLAVLLIGAMLGSARGPASILTYLVAGSAAPVLFAYPAGLSGPTGGYLIGFVLSAWLVGTLFARGWGRNRASMLSALLIGDAVIFIVGVPWLMAFMPPAYALKFGLLLCLPGEVLKISLAGVVLTRMNR